MANPSLQIGNDNWAIKEDNLLGYSTAGTRFVPQPITMTRATLGTRVNPSGLVEDVELLGSEEITNGDFATDSDWTKGTGWTISGGKAVAVVGTSSRLEQSISGLSGKYCKVNFTLSDYGGSGSVYVDFGSTNSSLINTNAEHTVYGTFDQNKFELFKGGAFSGSIDNVSVKEATIDNLPRVDYTDGTSSLLVEPQRTNLFTYSEDFTSGWSTSDATITSNSTISPNGTQNASTLTTTASGGTVQESLSISDGDIAFSLFVKKGSTDGVRLRIDASTDFNAYFDLTDGTIHSTTGNAKIETLDNDWYKISVSASVTSFVKASIYTTDGTTSYDNGTVFIYGAQIEQGSYPTSYISTSGSTVTRNQETYEKTGISDKINSTEGVLFVELSALANDGTSRRISLSDGSISNRVSLELDETANKIKAFISLSGTSQILEYTATNLLQFNKIAIKWKVNDFAIWFNGTEVATDSSGDVPTGMNQLSFTAGSTSHNFDGKVKQLQVFKTALSDSELATLTT